MSRGRWRMLGGVAFLSGAATIGVLLFLASPAGATSVAGGTVSPESAVAGANTTYTITFTTSTLTGAIPPAIPPGASCPSSCTITFTAPNGTNFSSIAGDYTVAAATGSATVGSVDATAVDGSLTANNVVITLSASSIGADDDVTVTVVNTSNPTLASSDYTIDESTSSDTTPTASGSYAVTAADASQLVVSAGNNQSTPAGDSFGTALTVSVEDRYGNVVTTGAGSNASVTFTPPPSGQPSATFGGSYTQTVTAADGVATSAVPMADDMAGAPYTVTGTSGALSSADFTLTNLGPASQLVITSSPVTGPASSTADLGPITVEQEDAFGDAVPATTSETVDLTSSSGGTHEFSATKNGTEVSSVDIASGSSTASFYYGDEQAGTPTITAASGELTNGQQAELVAPAAASKLVFTTQPGDGTAGSALSSQPVVSVEDTYGNTVSSGSGSSDTVQLTLSSGDFSTGSPTASVTASSGLADFSALQVNTAGSYTLTAADTTDGTISGATSSSFTVSAAGVSQLVFTNTPQSGSASSSASVGPFTVEEQDPYGNPTTTAETVNLTSSSTGTNYEFSATQNGTAVTSVPIASGSSTASFYYGDETAGHPTLTAAATGLTSGTQVETITAATPSKLVFVTTPLSGAASSTADIGPITVEEQDIYGNPTTTAETVNLSSNSTGTHEFSATQNGTAVTSVPIASGSSTASFYYGDEKAGSPTLSAAASGLTGATQPETVTPAAASKLVFSTPPGDGTAGSALSTQPAVNIEDPFGNLETSGSSSTDVVELTLSSGDFSNGDASASVTATGGTAGFSELQINVSGTYTMTSSDATENTVTGSTSPSFSVSPAPPSQMVIDSGNDQTTPAGSSFADALVVSVEDPYGNPEDDVEVTFTAPSAGPSVTFGNATNSETDASQSNGQVTSSVPKANDSAGDPYQVSVTSQGLPTIDFTLANSAPVAKLVFTTTAVTGPASSTASAGPINVQEQDTYGNPTTTAETVNLSSSSTGTAVFSATQNGTAVTSVDIPSGSSSVSFYYGDTKAGTPTITAASSGLASATQQETVTAATVEQLVFVTAPVSGTTSAGPDLGPLAVQEQDGFGNPTTTAETIDLSSSSAGGMFSASQNGSGVNSVDIPSGSSSVSFYYGDTNTGSPTVTAAASGLTSATQSETVSASAPSSAAYTGTLSTANLLADAVFAQPGVGPWQVGPGQNRSIYSSATTPLGPDYAAFNSGSGASSSFFQDVAVAPVAGHSYAGSVYLRSPGGSPVSATLVVWALGGSAPTEVGQSQLTVSGSSWSLYSTIIDVARTGHQLLRFQIYVSTDQTIDVAGALLEDAGLSDAGFSQGIGSWQVGPGQNRSIYESSTVPSGQNYLEVNSGTTPGASLYQDVPVTPVVGDTYEASVFLRSPTGTSVPVTVVVWALGGSAPEELGQTQVTVGTTSWMPFSTNVGIGDPGHQFLRFQIYVGAEDQNVDADEPTLEQSLVSDGGFDQPGLGPWQSNPTGTVESGSSGPSGENWLQITTGSSTPASLWQDVAVTPQAGHDYTTSMYLESTSDSPVSATLVIWALGGSAPEEYAAIPIEVGGSWTQFATSLAVADTGHGFLRVQLYISTPNATLAVAGVS